MKLFYHVSIKSFLQRRILITDFIISLDDKKCYNFCNYFAVLW